MLRRNIHISVASIAARKFLPLLILLPAMLLASQAAAQLPMPDVVCAGAVKHYWVDPNPGSAYTWKINGVVQPSTTNEIIITWDNTYPPSGSPYTLTVQEQSAAGCYGPLRSGQIVVSGEPPGVSFTSCFDAITTVNAKPIRLKGGIPLGGTYSGPGVAGGLLDPGIAGAGTHSITYAYTNSQGCTGTASSPIVILPAPAFTCGNSFTDVRDNSAYPTVTIGTQCWIASNLNYGLRITGSGAQTDNCVAEKYCYNDDPANCSSHGALYQWDELMQYGNTPSAQGLCMPGWHVPTENDWTTLLNFYQGESLAGKSLQDPWPGGFGAWPGGVLYLNDNWQFKGFATLFWTSVPDGQYRAVSRGLNTIDFSVSFYPSLRANGFGVRCVRD